MKEIKIGDTVKRIAGGTNGAFKQGDSFTVIRVKQTSVYDCNNVEHNKCNLELVEPVKPKESINNTYPIY